MSRDIDVESGGRRGSHYAIAIRLHSGRKIRSPVLVGKEQTRAVQAEIIQATEAGSDRVRARAARLFRVRRAVQSSHRA